MKTITVVGAIACVAITLGGLSGCKTDTIEFDSGPQPNVTHYGRPVAPPVNVSHYGPQPAPPVNVHHYGPPPTPPAQPVNVSHHGRPPAPAPHVSHHNQPAPNPRVSHHSNQQHDNRAQFQGVTAGVGNLTQAGAMPNLSHH